MGAIYSIGGAVMKIACCVMCLLLCGCAHSVLIINLGIGNKSAASLAATLTPEEYCYALTGAHISLKKRPAGLTQEQAAFCNTVEQAKVKSKGEKESGTKTDLHP